MIRTSRSRGHVPGNKFRSGSALAYHKQHSSWTGILLPLRAQQGFIKIIEHDARAVLPRQPDLPKHSADIRMGKELLKAQDFDDETMPKEVHKSAHFCSMKITQDVRDYAASLGVSEDDAPQKGMETKAVEFCKGGSEVWKKA